MKTQNHMMAGVEETPDLRRLDGERINQRRRRLLWQSRRSAERNQCLRNQQAQLEAQTEEKADIVDVELVDPEIGHPERNTKDRSRGEAWPGNRLDIHMEPCKKEGRME